MKIYGETTYRLRFAALVVGILFVLDGLYWLFKTSNIHYILIPIIGIFSMSFFFSKSIIILEEKELIIEKKYFISSVYRERYTNITGLSKYGIPRNMVLVIRIGDTKKLIQLGEIDNREEILDGLTKLSGIPITEEYPMWK